MWHVLGPLLVTLLVIMVDLCLDAFTPLIPSQVLTRERSKQRRRSAGPTLLVPSQVVKGRTGVRMQPVSSSTANSTVAKSTLPDSGASHPQKQSRRKKRPQKKRPKDSDEKELHEKKDFPLTGNLPDIYWRAVEMEHLRQHPQFQALPLPGHVAKLWCLEDARYFRQGSWQWDALHNGRCTTSQAVAALGFLEPTAGGILGIHPSWRRGGLGAYHRLNKPALRTIHEMNTILCSDAAIAEFETIKESGLWDLSSENSSFAARYFYETSVEEMQERKKLMRKVAQGEYLDKGVRRMWGNTQEATALLTALNYFHSQDASVTLKEVGMCGAGLQLNQTSIESSLVIGATPDAVICYGDNRIEALEVKNHCPFFSNRGRKRKSGRIKRFSIGDRPFDDKYGVFSQYIPQLQMEMLCLGPECRSAAMVRQTATQGALILRMQRDDEWIDEMLYWLHRFQLDFVERSKPPPTDFFWDGEREDRSRYRRFVNRTLELRGKVKVVSRIPNEMVQRLEEDAPMFLD